MALDDYRRWLDVGARDGRAGAIGLSVATDGKLDLHVVDSDDFAEAGDVFVDIALDYSDAGMLLDWLREALGIMLARQGDPVAIAALAGLQVARDTPATPEVPRTV